MLYTCYSSVSRISLTTIFQASVPGGQFIFVSPVGLISYPSAHSSLRPPGSKIGGFRHSSIRSYVGETIDVLFWDPQDGHRGLWACPTSPNVTVAKEAALKATTGQFFGYGCVSVTALQIREAGINLPRGRIHDYCSVAQSMVILASRLGLARGLEVWAFKQWRNDSVNSMHEL